MQSNNFVSPFLKTSTFVSPFLQPNESLNFKNKEDLDISEFDHKNKIQELRSQVKKLTQIKQKDTKADQNNQES